eukprot:30555-Pelagococcus_subviridis.AAC.2
MSSAPISSQPPSIVRDDVDAARTHFTRRAHPSFTRNQRPRNGLHRFLHDDRARLRARVRRVRAPRDALVQGARQGAVRVVRRDEILRAPRDDDDRVRGAARRQRRAGLLRGGGLRPGVHERQPERLPRQVRRPLLLPARLHLRVPHGDHRLLRSLRRVREDEHRGPRRVRGLAVLAPRVDPDRAQRRRPRRHRVPARLRPQEGDLVRVRRPHRGRRRAQARSIHWSPYDRVGVVNADP